MKRLRFWGLYVILTLDKLCRRRWPAAGLVLVCLFLPLGVGRAADCLLSGGVEFSGVVLAITAPEGDPVPRQLERYMGGMEDIAQYCRITAMGEEDALAALERGEVTAVLVLPEDFIHGVMWGDNPDLRLIVAGDRPLESLLLLWVGQSACDILSAFQSGVYAVLDLYEETLPPGLTRDQVVRDINLQYINLALNRGSLFQSREILATGTLPVALHYSLALLSGLVLAAAPLFVPVYSGGWLRFQRRLRCAGRGVSAGYFGAVAAGFLVLLPSLAPALLLMGRWKNLPALLGAAALMALFCSLFCGFCCLIPGSAAGCGTLAFAIALICLALAGGIVPTVLLPVPVQRLGWLSPVTWLMRAAAGPMGYPVPASAWAGLSLSGLGMLVLSLVLYRRRVDCEEAAL